MATSAGGDAGGSATRALLTSAVAGLVLVGCQGRERSASGRAAIWTDGLFDEWEGVAAAVVDPMGDAAPGSPVDFRAVAARDDPRFLHFLIDLGDTVTAQGMRGSVELVLDVDGDAASGGRYGGVDGADLIVVLSRQRDSAGGAHGAGVGIRRVGPDGPGDVEAVGGVGLLVAPTHSSDRFELRLERGAGVATGRAVAGRLRHVRGAEVADETPIFRHALVTEPGGEPPLWGTEEVAAAPGTHRVVVWNASSRSFQRNRRAFQRVLAGLGADVVLLDEVHADITMAELVEFGEGLGAGDERAAWSWWLASGGGRQRTVVGARGAEVRGVPGLARIDHAPGALERWLRGVGEGEGLGMASASALARAEAEGGLSATGAWVSVGGRDVLFVPVDLQSAGYDGSPRDRLRELQARALNRAIAATLRERPGAGLVIGGDLNLVGSIRPLDEVRRGLGLDGGRLAVARPERLRDRSLATWRPTWGDDPFSPGRLDYVLYRDGVLEVQRAFVFDAADMSAATLLELGILAQDTEQSDHLPLVVDFRVR